MAEQSVERQQTAQIEDAATAAEAAPPAGAEAPTARDDPTIADDATNERAPEADDAAPVEAEPPPADEQDAPPEEEPGLDHRGVLHRAHAFGEDHAALRTADGAPDVQDIAPPVDVAGIPLSDARAPLRDDDDDLIDFLIERAGTDAAGASTLRRPSDVREDDPVDIWHYGDDGHNVLIGTDGDDWIAAGGGEDQITGGGGDDFIDGGPRFDVVTLSGAPADYTVVDYDAGAGRLVIDGAAVGDGVDTLEDVEGLVFVDSETAVDLAHFGAGFTLGTPGDDDIHGGLADDRIAGLQGDDRLYGGAGDDTLYADVNVDFDWALTSQNGDDTLFGGAGDDTLVANGEWAWPDVGDTLNGGAGDDLYLNAGFGEIQITDESGTDTVGFTDRFSGSTFNGQAIYLDTDGNDFTINAMVITDHFTDPQIEHFAHHQTGVLYNILASADDASDAPDLFIGHGDQTVIAAGGGDDILFAGGQFLWPSEAATLMGGEGDDILFAASSGDDSLFGGAGDDYLAIQSYFGPADDPSLDGGAGVDTLSVGADRDDLEILAWDDESLTFAWHWDDDTVTARDIEALEFYSSTGDGAFDLASLPASILAGGTGDDSLIGTAANDLIHGRRGDDRLEGGAGDDTLYGGRGYDSLFGGAGDDVLVLRGGDMADGGAGADVYRFVDDLHGADPGRIEAAAPDGLDTLEIVGGVGIITGVDRIGDDFVISLNGHRVDVADQFAADAPLAVIAFTNYDDPDQAFAFAGGSVGGVANDVVFAASGAASGGGGDDLVIGLIDDDHLIGGVGDDFLTGGAGANVIDAGDGDDVLLATSADADLLYGGQGHDYIRVGGGGDHQAYGGAGYDGLHFDGGGGAVALYGGDGDDWMTGEYVWDPADRTGVVSLYGGAGDDYFEAPNLVAGDLIDGGEGFDVFFFADPGPSALSDLNIQSIERIEIGSSAVGQMTVTADAVDAVSGLEAGAGRLQLGDLGNGAEFTLDAADGWTHDGASGGFDRYVADSGSVLLIDTSATVIV